MSDEDEWGLGWGGDEECGCPPAAFQLPPPPPPPLLGPLCAQAHCEAVEGGPMGAHFDRALAYPTLPVVAVCSSVVLVAVLVASFLLWRHKTKVQNLLPCKHDQQGHLGELTIANGVSYEDVLINHHNTRMPQGQTLMPMELLDVKLGDIGPPQMSALQRTPFFTAHEAGQGLPFHPVYEEVSADKPVLTSKNYEMVVTGKSYESDLEGSGKPGITTSEDDFPDDEYPSGDGSGQCSATSSVRGSTGGDLCKDPVSSDEGTAEDFMVNDLPEMLQDGYPRRHLCDRGGRGNRHTSMGFPHHPDRTAKYQEHNIHKPHSADGGKTRILSPCHMSQLSYSPTVSTGNLRNSPHVTLSPNTQWMEDRIQYPDSENIYSTIDEDEVVDYPAPVHPSFTSLGCAQRAGPPPRHVVPKNASARRDRSTPLSQRSPEDCGNSYGDIMPAYNATPFT